MPGFDGTGPQGKGPMTGRGMGFCILQESKDRPGQFVGFAGIEGIPTGILTEKKGVINMPFGDRTGPIGVGPMTGRAAGFCTGYRIPSYMNPAFGGFSFYNLANFGVPHAGWVNPWLSRGIRCGRGFGRGRGRGGGRFGYWW